MLKTIGVIAGIGVAAGGGYYVVHNIQKAPVVNVQKEVVPATESATTTEQVKTETTDSKKKPLPIIQTTQTSSIGSTGANLSGKITPNALGEVSWWFEYGKTTSFGNTTAPVVRKITQGPSLPSLTLKYVTGLEPKTKYYYRLSAKNQNGTVNGATLSFTTH